MGLNNIVMMIISIGCPWEFYGDDGDFSKIVRRIPIVMMMISVDFLLECLNEDDYFYMVSIGVHSDNDDFFQICIGVL